MVYTDRQWLSFFELVGRADLLGDEQFASISARTRHIDALYQIVEQSLTQQTTGYWREELSRLGIACVAVLFTADPLADEHLEAVDFFDQVEHPSEGTLLIPRLPIRFSAQPPDIGRPAPTLNQHGPELGFDDEQIRSVIDEGALGAPQLTKTQPSGS